MPLPSVMQLKKASELEFGDVFALASHFSRNPNITLFQTITTSPLPVPLSPSKPLAPSPKKATSAKPSPSKSKSPNRRMASPRNGGSLATGHEETDWLKRMRPQRDPTPDPIIADIGENPTKTPNEEVVPGHPKEPATKRIKWVLVSCNNIMIDTLFRPNAELPIPPRRSTQREEMAKPKEPR